MWDSGSLYRMKPQVVFDWTAFPKDATRWSLD